MEGNLISKVKAPYFEGKPFGDSGDAYKIESTSFTRNDVMGVLSLYEYDITSGAYKKVTNTESVQVIVTRYSVVRDENNSIIMEDIPAVDKYGYVKRDTNGNIIMVSSPRYSEEYFYLYNTSKYTQTTASKYLSDNGITGVKAIDKIGLNGTSGRLKVVYRYTDSRNMKAEYTTYFIYSLS